MGALDLELEVLQKQMEAALRLSEDKLLAKNIRRKHRQSYHDTHRKVRFITVPLLLSLLLVIIILLLLSNSICTAKIVLLKTKKSILKTDDEWLEV